MIYTKNFDFFLKNVKRNTVENLLIFKLLQGSFFTVKKKFGIFTKKKYNHKNNRKIPQDFKIKKGFARIYKL